MSLAVRPPAPGQLAALSGMFADSAVGERYFSAPGKLERILADALRAGELFAAFGGDGAPLGVMRVRMRGFCGLYPYLALLGVAPAARGGGVGRFLLAEFERMARADGAARATLMASDFNTRALALYRSAGYWELGRLPDAVLPGVAEVVLAKDLPRG